MGTVTCVRITHAHVRTHTHIHIHTHSHIHTYTYTYTLTCTRSRAHIHTHTYTITCARTSTHTHTHTYTHTHAHMQAHAQEAECGVLHARQQARPVCWQVWRCRSRCVWGSSTATPFRAARAFAGPPVLHHHLCLSVSRQQVNLFLCFSYTRDSRFVTLWLGLARTLCIRCV